MWQNFCKLVVSKTNYKHFHTMNKGTNLISEIGQYFKENDAISHGSFMQGKKSGIEVAKFISCSRILPCGTNFFIAFAVWLSLCASIKRLWSSGFIFNVMNWFSPLKLRKICHLAKFFWTFILLINQQNSPIHKSIASTIKIPLSLRMQRNLKWKNRAWRMWKS